jgi:hypothetical protein
VGAELARERPRPHDATASFEGVLTQPFTGGWLIWRPVPYVIICDHVWFVWTCRTGT